MNQNCQWCGECSFCSKYPFWFFFSFHLSWRDAKISRNTPWRWSGPSKLIITFWLAHILKIEKSFESNRVLINNYKMQIATKNIFKIDWKIIKFIYKPFILAELLFEFTYVWLRLLSLIWIESFCLLLVLSIVVAVVVVVGDVVGIIVELLFMHLKSFVVLLVSNW